MVRRRPRSYPTTQLTMRLLVSSLPCTVQAAFPPQAEVERGGGVSLAAAPTHVARVAAAVVVSSSALQGSARGRGFRLAVRRKGGKAGHALQAEASDHVLGVRSQPEGGRSARETRQELPDEEHFVQGVLGARGELLWNCRQVEGHVAEGKQGRRQPGRTARRKEALYSLRIQDLHILL